MLFSGYVLSKAALKLIVERGLGDGGLCDKGVHGREDVLLGSCGDKLGIEFIQGDYVQNQEIVIEDNSQTAVTQVIGDDATEQPAQAEAPA